MCFFYSCILDDCSVSQQLATAPAAGDFLLFLDIHHGRWWIHCICITIKLLKFWIEKKKKETDPMRVLCFRFIYVFCASLFIPFSQQLHRLLPRDLAYYYLRPVFSSSGLC